MKDVLNEELVDTVGRKVEQGDTVLIYFEKWTTEVVDIIDGVLYTIWENAVKRVSTPVHLIEPSNIVVLIKNNGINVTDLEIKKKERLKW